MNDLISRQAAIEVADAVWGVTGDVNVAKVWNQIKDLPSAQPEMDEWCEDCKEYDTEKHCCPRWNRVIRDTVKEMEIIRCKDCRFYRPMEDEDDICEYRQMQVFEDDFCSRAERKPNGLV